jgi:DNA-directed RNA polymerase subunit F
MEILGVIAFGIFFGWLIPSPLSWFTRRSLEKRHRAEAAKLEDEMRLIRSHLHTQMEIDAEGAKQLKDEIGKLKHINQNLRITNHTLSTKPEQAELRLLQVYDRTLKIMERKFPVFVPTWRTMVGHVEKEMQQADQGLVPLVNSVVRPMGQIRDHLPGDADKVKLLSSDGAAESKHKLPK